MVVAAENCVVLGAGVPKTESVNPSRLTFPVPSIRYKEPTTGVVVVANVNVTTSADMLYALMAKVAEELPAAEEKVGGAPGPLCDNGLNVAPSYTRGLSVPMDKSEKHICSLSSIVLLCANVPGKIPVSTVYKNPGASVTFSSHIIPEASKAKV